MCNWSRKRIETEILTKKKLILLLLRPCFDTLNSTRKYLFIVAFLNAFEKTPILPRLNPKSVLFGEERLVDIMMKEKFGYAPHRLHKLTIQLLQKFKCNEIEENSQHIIRLYQNQEDVN